MLACGDADGAIILWNVELKKRLLALEGSSLQVNSLDWSPDGLLIASGTVGGTVQLWRLTRDGRGVIVSGEEREISLMHGYTSDRLNCVKWSPDGSVLAVTGSDDVISLLDPSTGACFSTLKGHGGSVFAMSWSPDGQRLVSGSVDQTLRVWDTKYGRQELTLQGHKGDINCVAWSPDGSTVVSASDDQTIRLWDPSVGSETKTIEAHTGVVQFVAYSRNGQLLASKGEDQTVRLWRCDTWESVGVLHEITGGWPSGLAFHPNLGILATLGAKDQAIRVWDLDSAALIRATVQSVRHTTAKLVLVGDSGAGKTCLGWRLAKGEFKEHPSTHGQQFWTVDSLKSKRSDGTECEAVLWDLAGQPDYRLIHALFLDDADLALVLFDPTDRQEPLHGVEFWLKTLKGRRTDRCASILIGTKTDRGESTLMPSEIDSFCRVQGVPGGYVSTSALTGRGVDAIIDRMRTLIPWETLTTTVTTSTFKRIKEYVLQLKGEQIPERTVIYPGQLRTQLAALDRQWRFTDDEMMTAIGHLAKHGYVKVLRTASGERAILLAPELLNNLASSFVLEARRNPRGLGSVDEAMVLRGDYRFPELLGFNEKQQQILLDAVTVLFLEHNVCFRESLGTASYLIFPELINLKKPAVDEPVLVDDVSYTVSGDVQNVYAALVVLLGYTNTFRRTDQWQHQAQYEVGRGEFCGFRKLTEREGEVEFVLSFSQNVPSHTRGIFQGLFERFLALRDLSVTRFPPLECPKCHYRQERSEVVKRVRDGHRFLFCSNCGKKLALVQPDVEISLTQESKRTLEVQQQTAASRTAFEASLVRVKAHVRNNKGIRTPSCFISYAVGIAEHEQWVERSLARDLEKAGIAVILDKWEGATIGSSVTRFVERIAECDYVLAVGTPLYKMKYENKGSHAGTIVAAELDLIQQRLLGSEEVKKTVLPLLLDGSSAASFPPLLRTRAYADFLAEENYFLEILKLILTMFGISNDSPLSAELRESPMLSKRADRSIAKMAVQRT